MRTSKTIETCDSKIKIRKILREERLLKENRKNIKINTLKGKNKKNPIRKIQKLIQKYQS
jgi:hypothetical protein